MIKIIRSECNYFDDLATYVIYLVSTGLTFEIYITGKAGAYKKNHSIKLDAKQIGKSLIIYPYETLNSLFEGGEWPQEIDIHEEVREKPPSDVKMNLGPLKIPNARILSSIFGNFYERNVRTVRGKFGNDVQIWPDTWNFGRVVRNALYHDGCILIHNQQARPVEWNTLSYSYADNGKQIIYTDLFPADIILLMMEMDSHL